MMHETTWFCQDVGAAPATGRRTAGAWAFNGRSFPSRRMYESLGLPLETGVGPGRGRGAGGQARARSSEQTVRGPMPATVGLVAERGGCQRLSQRTVDVGSHRRGDRAGVRGLLSPQSCMAAASSTLLVLSSAGMAGHAARRGRHRPLEALPVAAYKKTPDDLGPIWPSWMRAASCSLPRAGEPGGRRASRRWSSTTTNTTASRRWRSLPSAPPGTGSRSMSLLRKRTSRPFTSGQSFGACCATCLGRSFCCGTKAKSIKARSSGRSSWTTPPANGILPEVCSGTQPGRTDLARFQEQYGQQPAARHTGYPGQYSCKHLQGAPFPG
jgi:hypothetical protein